MPSLTARPRSKTKPTKAKAATQVPAPACSVADGFTLAAVGDIIYSEPLAGLTDQPFCDLVDLLHSADATFGNMETNLFDLEKFSGYPQAENGIPHLLGSPAVAEDMRAMGFNIVSRANNHTTDWGVEGMRATNETANAAGLVHAGTGSSMSVARAARYLQTRRGRVGLVSMASSVTPMSVAADPVGLTPGRPGLSALRVASVLSVPPEIMKFLHTLHDALPGSVLEVERWFREIKTPPGKKPAVDPNNLVFYTGGNYRAGGKTVRLTYDVNKRDLNEILKGIRQGKQNSDFLVATIHAHECDSAHDEPADFLPELAHAAIDGGADAFVGHGPHRLRGIEIYKGKPIFYSLGNFFFQLKLQDPLAADICEQLNVDPSTTTVHEALSKLVKVVFDAPVYYQSVVAVSRFERGRVAEVRLFPVDLGFGAGAVNQGIPRMASPRVGKAILEDLQRLSKPYGTHIVIKDNVGIIDCGR